MSIETITDAEVWVAQYRLTGNMNALALDYSAELRSAPAFGDTGARRVAGFFDAQAQLEGYYDSALDAGMFAGVGSQLPVSAAPHPADGNRAFLFRGMPGEVRPQGAAGDLYRYSIPILGSEGKKLVRGLIMMDATKTATANGTAYQLGTVAAAQSLYAALHVSAASGAAPTLDVTIESDNAEAFLSPAVRLTFAQLAAAGYEWKSVAGAITDDWWRAVVTIAGGTPSFRLFITAGIL